MLLWAFLVAASCCLAPSEAVSQGPRSGPYPPIGRYSLPRSLLTKPFTFAGELIPLQRRDVRERIESQINFLLMDARSVLTDWLSQRTRYSWLIEEILVKEGVPKDFALFSTIAGGLNIFASAKGSTAGWWALSNPCSASEGVDMTVDTWHDDRMDLELSTKCFAARLKDARKELSSPGWLMPLAAYLSSTKTIQELQQRWNTAVFWDLPLPETAEDPVIRWIALGIIDGNRNAFGLQFKEAPPLIFDLVSGLVLTKDLPISEVARMTGTPPREILELNPKVKASQPVFPAVVKNQRPAHTIAAPRGKGRVLVNRLTRKGYLETPLKP